MDSVCPLEVTSDELARIRQCEAVVVRELERADGSRVARPVAWGDEDEMREAADTPGLFIVPPGVTIVAQTMLRVSELLEPEDAV